MGGRGVPFERISCAASITVGVEVTFIWRRTELLGKLVTLDVGTELLGKVVGSIGASNLRRPLNGTSVTVTSPTDSKLTSSTWEFIDRLVGEFS